MITIIKLSVGTNISFWVNWQPGIYYINFNGNYSFIDSSLLINVPTYSGISEVNSVFSDGDALTQVSNTSDLINGPSFYYDSINNGLYIRLANYDPPNVHTINVGPVYGFSDQTHIDETTGTYYESRLLSTVDVLRKKDPLYFGKMTYSDFTIEADNSDGFFYDVRNWDVYGQPIEVRYGNASESVINFPIIKTGRVKEYSFVGDRFIITAQDTRRILSKTLPTTILSAATYADIDRDEGKYVPIVYGECRGVPCRALDDGATTPSSYTFICADVTDHVAGIKAIDKVYIDGAVVTPASTNLTAGTFTVGSASFAPGNVVTADIKGYVDGSGDLIENPLDIIKDILTTYIDVEYNTNYFNTTIWANATIGKPSVGYCAYKSTTIAKIIEDIGASLLEGLDISPDNKFTWLSHSDGTAPIFKIKAEDWLAMPSVEFSSDEAVSSATVQYSPFWNTGSYKSVIDNDNYATFFSKFKGANDGTFTTVLSAMADAESLAEYISDSYDDVQIFITGQVNLNLTYNEYPYDLIDVNQGDNIDIEIDGIEIRDGKIVRTDFIGRIKAEVIELTLSPEIDKAEIKARYISTYETVITDTAPVGTFILGYDYLAVGGIINV